MVFIRDAIFPEVRISAVDAELSGSLALPDRAAGIVLFSHGSGSSRHSPRNRFVASVLQRANVATLLFDLLTRKEKARDELTREHRFDIGLLSRRLVDTSQWVQSQTELRDLPLAYFGASTGSAAALVAASILGRRVVGVVSRGGRPDLAGDAALIGVLAPTLLIVGGLDGTVIELNERAYEKLRCEKDFAVVTGASHLFEEPGTLERVASLASDWFLTHLLAPVSRR